MRARGGIGNGSHVPITAIVSEHYYCVSNHHSGPGLQSAGLEHPFT